MSLIPVVAEPVQHPYYVEPLGVHVGSSKELCYVIYNNPLLVMQNFVNDRLIAFIRNELGLVYLAEKLVSWRNSGEDQDELLIIILNVCNYYTPKEVNRFRQRIEAYRKLSTTEFTKETADYYFGLRQYGTAVQYYEKILNDWRVKSLTDEFTASVWNNIGASYAGIFWFEKAMDAYDASYNFRKDMDTVKRIYQLTLLNPELRMKARYDSLITEERKNTWKKELYDAMQEAEKSPEVAKVNALFEKKDSLRRAEGAEAVISRWKREYRKML